MMRGELVALLQNCRMPTLELYLGITILQSVLLRADDLI
jgi:hypothetical protein